MIDPEEALSRIHNNINAKLSQQIITANPLMLLEALSDSALSNAFDRATLVLPESAGLALLSRLQNFSIPKRIAGIDFMLKLCRDAEINFWPVYLLGGKPGVSERAALTLREQFPQLRIAGYAHGHMSVFEENKVTLEIAGHTPLLLFVGLGSPAQEKWINLHIDGWDGLGICAMGVGGSLDVLAKDIRRAPQWVQRWGWEWLYRAWQEPWRWKRTFKLPLFLIYALMYRTPKD